MAVSSVVASDMVPLKNRALAQGLGNKSSTHSFSSASRPDTFSFGPANIFFGAGSGLGGPAGGFISDRLGWRSAFLLQVPLLTISIALVFINVRYRVPGQGKSKREMARRIDYFGSATLIVALSSLLFALSYKNNENLPWSHPLVWSLCIVFVVFAAAFVLVEGFVAAEPVMPLRYVASLVTCLSPSFSHFIRSLRVTNVHLSFLLYSTSQHPPTTKRHLRLPSQLHSLRHNILNPLLLPFLFRNCPLPLRLSIGSSSPP